LARSARGSERVDVVVDEPLEGVEAFGPEGPRKVMPAGVAKAVPERVKVTSVT